MARETVSKMVFGPTGDIVSDRIKEVRYIKDLEQRNAALEAERDRLRGSLVEIANWCGRPLNIKCNECGPGYWPHCHELVMIARKAMEE